MRLIGNIMISVLGLVTLISYTQRDNLLLYTIYTKHGDIKCHYHNSRDVNGDYMPVDGMDGETKYIRLSSIDSITIHKESMWVCGPKSDNIKYCYGKH